MNQPTIQDVIVKKEVLLKLIANKLIEQNVSEEQAQVVSEVLVHADLRGVHSHGAIRTEHYVNRIKQGGLNVNPKITVEKVSPSVSKVNGDHGLGHVIAKRTIEEAIESASNTGVGVGVAFNSSHCGALSYYMQLATNAGKIGIAMQHTDSFVAPFGAKDAFLGTNPIAFGIPANNNPPIILDMATSNVAMGKILVEKERGNKIPLNWGVDVDGNPTDNPNEVAALLPFGGPKGYGISLMVDILSGILVGAKFGPHIEPMYGDLTKHRELGIIFIVLDPKFFGSMNYFLDNIDQLYKEIHDLQPATGFSKVLLPGEPENNKSEERIEAGIPLPETILAYLKS
ncbi:ureidoglycolate dehydrogenase [Solibacillus sp. FSL W8-0474]|uniref:ureidoglycolate dehydrogenase n=1 Tax=Solibacillus sp. FSL W8-0474 TaxID=2975336 RepID=UPI0030F71E4A